MQYETDDVEEEETLPPSKQKLRIMLDKRNRKGKEVTLVTGFVGSDDDLKDLARSLKTKCGVGGSARGGRDPDTGRLQAACQRPALCRRLQRQNHLTANS